MSKLISVLILILVSITTARCISISLNEKQDSMLKIKERRSRFRNTTSSSKLDDNENFYCPDLVNNKNLTKDECCTKYKPLVDSLQNFTSNFQKLLSELDIEPELIDAPDPTDLKQVFSLTKRVCREIFKRDWVSSFRDVNIANISMYSPIRLQFTLNYFVHNFCSLVVDNDWALKMNFLNQTTKEIVENYQNLSAQLLSTYKTLKAEIKQETEIYFKNLTTPSRRTVRSNSERDTFNQTSCDQFNLKFVYQINGASKVSFDLADFKDLDKFYYLYKNECEKAMKLPLLMSKDLNKLKTYQGSQEDNLTIVKLYCVFILDLPQLIVNSSSLHYQKMELLTNAERYQLELKKQFESLKTLMLFQK